MRGQSVGELLDAAVTLSLRHALPLAAIAAVSFLPSLAGEVFEDVTLDRSKTLSASLAKLLVEAFMIAGNVISENAMVLAVDDIASGETPNVLASLRSGLRLFWPNLGVFARYLPAMLILGGIFYAGVRGIASNTSLPLAILASAVTLVPLALTLLGSEVGINHRILRGRHPGAERFAGGVAVFSDAGRSLLAALAVIGLCAPSYAIGPLLERFSPVNPLLQAPIQQAAWLPAGVLLGVFVTLFYLDICARDTGNDLIEASRTLEEGAAAS